MIRFPIFHLHKYYNKKEIANAFLTGVIYHIIGLVGLGLILANLIFLYIPYLVYFLTSAFILGSFILARGNTVIIDQLKKETHLATFPYERMYKQNTLFDITLLFIALIGLYFTIN
ncbi:MAG: hypothetical protein UMR38_00540 [Candidatus Izemoplasma sp.]|nr:hypothetical protein [Candidatus Izemoplasma sp.]